MIDDDTLIFIVIALLFVIMMGCLVVYINKATCMNQTRYMEYQSRWGVWSGCMIEIKPDIWIPLDRYYFRPGGEQ